MLRWIKIICPFIFVLSTAACAGSATPQLIAAYPGSSQGPDFSGTPNQFIPTPAPCSAFVEIEVPNLEKAAGEASDLADSYSAYVTSMRSWSDNHYKLTNLTIVAPQPEFNNLRSRLLELGPRLDDSLLGNPAYSSLAYCQISLTIAQKTTNLPSINWNPIHTLRNALSLSVSIFGFLVDGLIWIVVVLGPFILMGLGVRAVLQRRSKPQ